MHTKPARKIGFYIVKINKPTVGILVITAIAVISWSAFWVFSTYKTKDALEEFLSNGMGEFQISHSSLSIRGFPNRTDITIHGVVIEDSRKNFMWKIGDLVLHKLVYDFHNFILVFPSLQTLSFDNVEYTFHSEKMRTSLSIHPLSRVPLDELITELGPSSLTSSDGWKWQMDSGIMAFQRMAENSNEFRFYQEFESASAEGSPSSSSIVPYLLPPLSVNGTMALKDSPWALGCAEIRNINLNTFKLAAKGFEVNAPGDFEFNQEGYPLGSMIISVTGDARNFESILRMLGLSDVEAKVATELAKRSLLSIDFEGPTVKIAKILSANSRQVHAIC